MKTFPKNTNKKKYNNRKEVTNFEQYLLFLPCQVYNYLCLQKGVKEIQRILSFSSKECHTILINSLGSSISIVMMDLYGNYFIQEFVKSLNSNQITLILNYISNSFVTISHNSYGTYSIQALLEHIKASHEQIIINSIAGSEIEMVIDSNATHVLQKIIMIVNEKKRTSLNEIIYSNFEKLCCAQNGICLIKKFITKIQSEVNLNRVITLLSQCCLNISENPYGNYAIQFIMDELHLEIIKPIVNILITNIVFISTQKFSSNVAEKVIALSNKEQFMRISSIILSQKNIINVIKNKYGRYVVKKLLLRMTQEQKESIISNFESVNVSTMKERIIINAFIDFVNI